MAIIVLEPGICAHQDWQRAPLMKLLSVHALHGGMKAHAIDWMPLQKSEQPVFSVVGSFRVVTVWASARITQSTSMQKHMLAGVDFLHHRRPMSWPCLGFRVLLALTMVVEVRLYIWLSDQATK